MQRAAIYARLRSQQRNERSCQDQIDLCRAWAGHHGFEIVAAFSDQAAAGASIASRLEFGRLMRSARNHEFDVVIAEAPDRLGRDDADLATLEQHLAVLDVSIATIPAGEVGAVPKGPMGEALLTALAARTRRGQRARVLAGAAGGGRSYGYDPTPGKPGELGINPREAAIVRRIFAEYRAGDTPRAIVQRLNHEGVPGPRGGAWNASTINGSRSRQNGIVQNALYAGEIVWNRQRFIRDPGTGRRVSRPNPASEWIRTEAPQLRIVDDETFVAAAARKARVGALRPEVSRRPAYLLSGLVKCAACGSSFVVSGRNRLACSAHREQGTCSNSATIDRAEIETRVLAALHRQMGEPEVVAAFVRDYQAERQLLAQMTNASRDEREARLKLLRDGIERIVDRVVDGTAPEAMVARMDAMEAERKRLQS
ncbi:MAG TPA: recombinase family protein, partial [Devosia sp.]|nr:recombinase family protein [Devosia sp.]